MAAFFISRRSRRFGSQISLINILILRSQSSCPHQGYQNLRDLLYLICEICGKQKIKTLSLNLILFQIFHVCVDRFLCGNGCLTGWCWYFIVIEIRIKQHRLAGIC